MTDENLSRNTAQPRDAETCVADSHRALLAAIVLSLTFVPAAVAVFLNGRVAERENLLIRTAKRAYEPLLLAALRMRWALVAAATALVVASGWLATTLGSEFVPQLDEGDIAVQALRITGTSLPLA